MAVSYTVPNTFSALTLAESAKVNANEQYTKTVFDGLEATTTTLLKLKMDANPTAALEVATKQYVDVYSTYRRPVLQFASVSTVAVEAGLTGTAGAIPIVFPDGDKRTESTSTRTTFDITRNATLVTSGARSGLRASLSEAANTIYALYAVKVSDSTTQWCTVGDTVSPTQDNYSTLVSNFGANSWVFLGYICNGAAATQTTDICDFVQAGNTTILKNVLATANVQGSGRDKHGIRMATTAGATSLTTSPTAGSVVGTNYPATASHLMWTFVINAPTASAYYGDSTVTTSGGSVLGTLASLAGVEQSAGETLPATSGAGMANASASSVAQTIILRGWVDGALGVGANPML